MTMDRRKGPDKLGPSYTVLQKAEGNVYLTSSIVLYSSETGNVWRRSENDMQHIT